MEMRLKEFIQMHDGYESEWEMLVVLLKERVCVLIPP